MIRNGVDLTRFAGPSDPAQVRAELGLPPGVRIIAVSATAEADAVRVGPGLEADAFLAKPLDRERLLREIARQLGLRWTMASMSAAQPL